MAKGAHSATQIKGDLLEFTPASGTQVLNVRPDAFYNLTMGYRGWTHHSGWGYVKLKKGKAVTITAYTDVVGLHPGIAVWYTPQGKKYAPINYANDHFYNQWENIFVKNAKDDTSDEIVGNMKMEFITNGFDRDGMGDSIPGEYDQSFVNRILDGVVGKVSVTFTPPATGYYKFVVGGINPDGAMAVAPGLTTKQPVAVDINFPQ
jgi:hypothetical protein